MRAEMSWSGPDPGSSPELDALRREHSLLLEVFDLTDDLAVLLDAEGRLVHLNAAARRFYGLDAGTGARMLGDNWRPTGPSLDPVVERIAHDPDGFHRWSGEVDAVRADGVHVPMLLQLIAHRSRPDGPIEYISGVARDISDRKLLEATLERQATHDPLTGLANRSLLLQRTARALEGLSQAGSAHTAALLFVDLDRFKGINDQLGHEVGDQVLVEVGRRLIDVVRPGDTVARFGGDEFVLLCERLDDAADAVVIAGRVDTSLARPFHVDGLELQIGASIGISVANGDDVDPNAVLRDADAAMYRAKTSSEDSRVVYDEGLRRQARERRRLESALRDAADGDGLELRYQPIVDLGSGRVTGVEALLRWRLEGELIPPERFVPVAEQTGLIVPIGAWVLRTAAEQVPRCAAAAGHAPLCVSVNVSARQLDDAEIERLIAELAEQLDPVALRLEITESVLLGDVGAARHRLDRVKAMGVGIAMDDFGTGYSSLTYLRELPVDVVKLDRSFVAGLHTGSGDTAIVEAVIRLAHALGKECVAEGIETEIQLDTLRRLGCEAGQGDLFAPPLDAGELVELLRQR